MMDAGREAGVGGDATTGREESLRARLTFPAGFLWGAATSSYQVEGGVTASDWSDWKNGSAGDAAGWWAGNAEQDLRTAASLGHQAHRLSLEWSRLEPRPGEFNARAFDRYREILGCIRDLGMRANVTIHHFTLPHWAAAAGAWLNDELPDRFARYAALCVERLGDLADHWATLNEPTILVYFGYLGRRWPPGGGSVRAGIRALRHLLRAHGAAVGSIHAVSPDARVGIVLNMPALEPDRPGPADRLAAAAQNAALNGLVLRALRDGRLPAPLSLRREPLPGGGNSADWYGLNYYGRHRIRFAPTRPGRLFGREVQPGARDGVVSWGEVWPPGLTKGLLQIAALGRPLYVTENGINDAADTLRPAYLLRHVRAMHDAISAGADVRGYFHWSLIDNFEWAEAWTAHFGLIALDPVTQERRIRHSAHVYARIIRDHALTPTLWAEEPTLQLKLSPLPPTQSLPDSNSPL